MKLFVDTTGKDLYIAIFWNNMLYKKIHIKDIAKKVDPLVSEFQSLLASDTSLIDNINDYYILVGPGSFTGSRSALIYFKTFAGVLGKNVYVANTFDVISTYKKDFNLYLNATKKESFKWNRWFKKIKVVKKSKKEVDIDYELVEENIKKIFEKFTPVHLAKIIDPLYGKNPQIGPSK